MAGCAKAFQLPMGELASGCRDLSVLLLTLQVLGWERRAKSAWVNFNYSPAQGTFWHRFSGCPVQRFDSPILY